MPEFFKGADALIVSLRAEPIFAMTIPGRVSAYRLGPMPILAMIDGEGAQVVREAGAGMVAPQEMARSSLDWRCRWPHCRPRRARRHGCQGTRLRPAAVRPRQLDQPARSDAGRGQR